MSTMTIDKSGPTRKVKYGSMSRDRTWALRWSYFFLVLFAIFSLTPPLYMLITSLKGSAEISAATNPWWVYHPTLENYVELLTSNQFLRFFWNSAWVSIIVVTITMLISVPAAFALARMKFWGSATLATGVFLTYLIPDSLLFIPLFKMFAVFGDWTGIQLINRWYVLVFIYPTLTVPFCTWIMIGYFASIPKELDEAAIIDGASWFQTLTRIFIPVALPGLIAATIFAFTVSWAQFLYPLVFTTSTDQLVLPVGIITTLIKGDVFNWGQIMTGALLGAAPPLIIYAFLMDYYIAGLTAGAWFGEGTVLKNELRRYDVVALRDTRLAMMDRRTFVWLFENSVGFNRFLVGSLNERLGQFIALLEYGRTLDATARLARSIASLFNPILYPDLTLHLEITQEEIGALSGISRQNANQCLKRLEREGLLRLEYGGVTIINLDRLRHYGE